MTAYIILLKIFYEVTFNTENRFKMFNIPVFIFFQRPF